MPNNVNLTYLLFPKLVLLHNRLELLAHADVIVPELGILLIVLLQHGCDLRQSVLELGLRLLASFLLLADF